MFQLHLYGIETRIRTLPASIYAGSNCTFMELKQEMDLGDALGIVGSNCTFMELKHQTGKVFNTRKGRVLIAPLWN